MNMILKKKLMNNRGSQGVTLVEAIIVLVILTILAAIAIPALTGYTDNAEDKKYIADACNAMIAIRSIIDETYADGTLGKGGWGNDSFVRNHRNCQFVIDMTIHPCYYLDINQNM
ncbi:MAG: type II secretion system GspH family protein [Clostridiales Family XIII bacterium]|jgi:prepilin-type N-terminal cleavage/methylation domain-containing protein|nr:type II secretion system GspH family protein [Clostridiales Family XIII bacterium]